MKNNWKHLNFENRKVIRSGISNHRFLFEISDQTQIDPTAISREVKRNRIKIRNGSKTVECPKVTRWPHVCDNCSKRYQSCGFNKYKYDPKIAQEKANFNLVHTRRGIDMTEEEFRVLDNIIKEGVDSNDSIYEICIKNKDKINISIPTVYKYIAKGFLQTKRNNLPYAGTYKKRKHKKKYDYNQSKIDRTNHTYLDYLSILINNPGIITWQLDFLGSITTDNNTILSLIQPDMQFPLIELMTNPKAIDVTKFFDKIEYNIGFDNFKRLFPVILTDRDPRFTDIDGITTSKITGTERCKLFFCDPYVSSQKPNVENLNKRLRRYFPKRKSIDDLTKKDVKKVCESLHIKPVKILDHYTPKDAFAKIFSEELYNLLLK